MKMKVSAFLLVIVIKKGVIIMVFNGMFLLGIVFMGIGVLLTVTSNRKKRRCSCKADGRITGIHENEGTDNDGQKNYSYSPEYEYEVNGKTYRDYADRSYYNPNKIQIGGNIDVYYNPENPDEHYTKGGIKIRPLLGTVAISIGALLILSTF